MSDCTGPVIEPQTSRAHNDASTTSKIITQQKYKMYQNCSFKEATLPLDLLHACDKRMQVLVTYVEVLFAIFQCLLTLKS